MACPSRTAYHGKGHNKQDQRSNGGGLGNTAEAYDDDTDVGTPVDDDEAAQVSYIDGSLGIMIHQTMSTESGSGVSDPRSVSQSSLTIRTVDIHLDDGKLDAMDIDLDRYPSSPATVNMSPTAMHFADVSNYLQDSHMCDQVATHLSFAELESARYAAPNDDVYGWNAEWERGLNVPPTRVDTIRDVVPRHRSLRASRLRGHKGNLLKKVFSVSKT